MCGWLGQLGIKVIVRPAFGFVWVAAYSFCTSGDKFWIQCSVGNFKRVNYFGGGLHFDLLCKQIDNASTVLESELLLVSLS